MNTGDVIDGYRQDTNQVISRSAIDAQAELTGLKVRRRLAEHSPDATAPASLGPAYRGSAA